MKKQARGRGSEKKTGDNLKKLLLRKRGEIGFALACNFTVVLLIGLLISQINWHLNCQLIYKRSFLFDFT